MSSSKQTSLSMQQLLQQLHDIRNSTKNIRRGKLPVVDFSKQSSPVVILTLVTFIVSFIVSGMIYGAVIGNLIFPDGHDALAGFLTILLAATTAISCAVLYITYPLVKALWLTRVKKQKPGEDIFLGFQDKKRRFLIPLLFRYDLVTPPLELENVSIKSKVAYVNGLFDKKEEPPLNINRDTKGFGLWLGKSTGKLANLWHKAGLAPNQEVLLNLEDATKNILVLGGTGSGKTTCVMHPILLQCLDHQCGGLIFDIKGNFKHAVVELAKTTNRNLVTIGPGYAQINLLEGLTPEIAASFLKSALLLSSHQNIEAFWLDTASELCRNVLGILLFLPQYYSLQGLYFYIFDTDTRQKINKEIDNLLPTLTTEQQRLLRVYCKYYDDIFEHFDEKVKSGVKATVSQVLSPFNHPSLLDAFCAATKDSIRFEDVLTGTVYLVDMPLSVWGLGGKVAYTFIKLCFFNTMQNRQHNLHLDQDTPVFFMCDEFQEIVSANKDGLSDLNFWDKSRSSKTIGIISGQSIASFYAAIGNRDLANALLQNFRQRICFKTDDTCTLGFMDFLAGRAKVKKVTLSEGYSAGVNNADGNQQSSYYSNKSISEDRESVLDAQLFRDLPPKNAIALLSMDGYSMDDVLLLTPIYLDK